MFLLYIQLMFCSMLVQFFSSLKEECEQVMYNNSFLLFGFLITHSLEVDAPW